MSSLWRAHGGNGNGVAIVLDPAKLDFAAEFALTLAKVSVHRRSQTVLAARQFCNNRRMLLIQRHRVMWSIVLASLLSWCASLALPAITLGTFSVNGWQFLVYGWQGLGALSIGGVSWLANPLLVLAWATLTAPRYAQWGLACAWSAAAAALTTFVFNMSGGGAGLLISGYDIGFYLWLAAALLQPAASTLYFLKSRSPDGPLHAHGTPPQ